MDLNLGTIVNSVSNIGASLGNGSGEDNSLKRFLDMVGTYGIQVNCNYEVDYNGFDGLNFFIQSIQLPGLKGNVGTLYYKGREIEIPVNYTHDHLFTMTVLNDACGFIYSKIRNILINDFNNRLIENAYTMKITGLGDKNNYSGIIIKCKGIRFNSISGLQFSLSDNSLLTFTLEGNILEIDFGYTDTRKKGGILNQVDKFSSTINNILG